MNNTSPLNMIETAHQMYRDGNYDEALCFYTDALFLAKTRPQKIALHSNRAACFLKLHDFKKAAEECTSVLEFDHKHTGALMLRAQTLVTLKEYHSALFDVNRLMELNPTSDVYQNLEARLRTQLSLAPIPESEAEFDEEEDEDEENNENEVFEQEEELQEVENVDNSVDDTVQDSEPPINPVNAEIVISQRPNAEDSPEKGKDQKSEPRKTIAAEVIAQAQRKTEPRKTIAAEVIAQSQKTKESSQRQNSKSWQTIPKPKGHSALDYGRWDKVIKDDSSEDDSDDDDEEDSQPQYRFRVKTVGVRPVK